jgi:hypothetical protein
MPDGTQRRCAKNQQVVWPFGRRLYDLSGGVSVSHQFADVTAIPFFSRDPGAQVRHRVGAVRLNDVESGDGCIETPG